MTRRGRLIRNTLLGGAIPVVGLSAWIILRDRVPDDPYVAGQETEGITRALERAPEETGVLLRFADVTDAAGIGFTHFPFRRTGQLPEDMGPGAAWADYDGDGLFDLFLVNFAAPVGIPDEEMGGSAATDRLYRNLGDGTFEDVTGAAGLGAPHRGLGAAWGDFDADGDADLFVTSWGENLLWENRGDGTFRNVTRRAGIHGEGFWTAAAWADPDRDGDLDLYVCGYVRYEAQDPERLANLAGDFPFTLNPSSWPPHENRFWINQGNGTFVEGAQAAGILGESGKSLGAAWADFDADGWPDLYVANDVSDNAMYRNRGDGTFEDISYAAIVADYRGAMGMAVGDWDGDLDLDLFITHWIAQENALYSSQLADFADDPAAEFLFVDDADRVGLGQIALDLIGWGTAFVDLDLDGREDLFVANGSTFQDRDDPARLVPMHPHLYQNRGPDEGFFEVGGAAGLRSDPPGVGRGAAYCDFDEDGDADLLISRHGAAPRLLRNDSARGRWMKLSLRAVTGHPSGLGTRIVAHAGGRAVLREAGAGPSYLSQNDPRVHLGLGSVARIDSLQVRWPGGREETWRDLEVDAAWELREGSAPRRLADRGAAPSRRTSGRSEHAVVADLTTELSRDEIRRFWKLKREADDHLRRSEWDEAAAVLEEAIGVDPRHEDALYGLGNARLELGEYADALRSWERLLEVNPAASRAWVQIGTVRSTPAAAALFDLAAAADAFERAHELNPEHSGPLALWGEAALAAGDLATAERVLASACAMSDRSTSAFYLSGYLAWKRSDGARARELLQRAVGSLEADAPPTGVLGEGDARTADMAELQREAASRGLFAACVERLRELGSDVDPASAFAAVDEVREALPTR